MERRKFGSTDMEVSILGFGGAEIGFEGADAATVERLLGSALDAGLNMLDTAECYKDSEELIGKTIAHRRNEYYLFTKCGHASGLEGNDWDPKMLAASIDRSLKRLKTDYVDVVHLHSCNEETLRQGDVIDVLKRAKEQGKTRYIGYSGDHKAALYAVECGAFDSLETSINIADQEAIELTLPKARERGMGVIAKRPIANASWKYYSFPSVQYHQAYWERLQKLQYDFLKAPMQEVVSTALRFTLAQQGVCTAIVGTAKPDRWVENATLVAQGRLPEETVQAIRRRWSEVAGADWIGLE
ncbi:aldo/keto reductase [Paenibacillus antri]|uniref:Aldo/keto reductase n=1 Tax=Paenibacillus antri TaxID=2582848 RepID=A0A5R9GI86_9BACL|nr:aldo/keto reductase [Paenibacillus antri]TLS51235.1 aldo/keto reductase [Paenibacillus antri]